VPKPFNVRVERGEANEVSVLALEGFVDAHTAPEFERAIQAQVDAGRVRLVVNCSGLTYRSSAGLGVFMGFVEEVRERGVTSRSAA
jgi:anti-sigma B factor antagonist